MDVRVTKIARREIRANEWPPLMIYLESRGVGVLWPRVYTDCDRHSDPCIIHSDAASSQLSATSSPSARAAAFFALSRSRFFNFLSLLRLTRFTLSASSFSEAPSSAFALRSRVSTAFFRIAILVFLPFRVFFLAIFHVAEWCRTGGPLESIVVTRHGSEHPDQCMHDRASTSSPETAATLRESSASGDRLSRK